MPFMLARERRAFSKSFLFQNNRPGTHLGQGGIEGAVARKGAGVAWLDVLESRQALTACLPDARVLPIGVGVVRAGVAQAIGEGPELIDRTSHAGAARQLDGGGHGYVAGESRHSGGWVRCITRDARHLAGVG